MRFADPFWTDSFRTGTLVEKGIFKDYDTVLIENNQPIGTFLYPYRLFFFKHGEKIPTLSLNLEIGLMFDTVFLGAFTRNKHFTIKSADPNMSLEDFKKWAYKEAESWLLKAKKDIDD
ncbi:hypothetical protein [Nitrosophilus kaiyonis]|uniref:hypothetical protein n=1 Tax=Nitrosophilus kaiyonis TaxID=2930200 RepID=UPI00248FA6CC|nr:hypothetical protein [Nitrosophilus kaiyonis]